jgi:two-component system, NtrC family, response regulator GlrR
MRTTAPLGRSRVRIVPKVELIVQAGLQRGLKVECAQGALVIGSEKGCDLALEDSTVSARHCELSLSPDGIHLRDLGSKNGVRVGAAWLKEGFIDPGAVITVGETEILVKSPGSTEVTLSEKDRFGPLLGKSVAMRALFARIPDLAKSNAPLLIEGETGTGKGLFARAVHEQSGRGGGLSTLDCPDTGTVALQRALEEADDDGTLFLDEVGELPAPAQRTLSGWLERPGKVRIITASTLPLKFEANAGRFRPELLHRISGLKVVMPPLRQRMEDIPLLTDVLLSAASSPLTFDKLPESTQVMLQLHRWPGNVRELKNVVDRLVAYGERSGRLLDGEAGLPFSEGNPDIFLPLSEARDRATDAFEQRYLEVLMKRSEGGVSQGARMAKISRQFLQRLLRKHGIR